VIWKVSIRRACEVLRAGRSTYHYVSRSSSQADLRERIREIAETRVRYGYRRIHVLLRREGWEVNAKRVYRLYREEGLQLRNKTPKRKVKAKLREGRADPVRRNDVWAMDFVHDQLYDGRKIRILNIIDAYTRFVPAIDVRGSYTIRVDQGPEFVSKDLDLWAYAKNVELDFSRPGKPTDNAFIESLNGKFRAECLNAHWFMNLADARRKCELWRVEYNNHRPHSAIGYKVPAALMMSPGSGSPP
jgi:putative transposase